MELGKKLIEIRRDNKMTQEDFAEKFCVTHQTVSNWENGKTYPDLETLVCISDEFDVSLDTLLKGDKKMVSDISKYQKNGRWYAKMIKLGITILVLFALAFTFYAIRYYQVRTQAESKYNNAIRENGFIAEKHPEESEMYDMFKDEDGIQYRITWTIFPKFSSIHLDYEEPFKMVRAVIQPDKGDDYSINVVTFENKTHIYFSENTEKSSSGQIMQEKPIVIDGKECIAQTTTSSELDIESAYTENENAINRAVKRSNELYSQLYIK